MALQCETAAKDEIKTQFLTREGNYKLMTSAEYSRPNRLGYSAQGNNTPVKVSFVSLPTTQLCDSLTSSSGCNNNNCNVSDRICFNVGRELYVYSYKGVKKVIESIEIDNYRLSNYC